MVLAEGTAEMSISTVKAGVVGLGLVGDSHIRAYQAHPKAQVAAVCDLDPARARAVAENYGIPRWYSSYADMLADPDINTVAITTPTLLHAPMAIAAAKAGKNILCEKPFCLTLAEGEAACAAAAANRVTLAVGESYIFMTPIMKARQLIEAGEIGRPLQVRQRFGSWIERPGALDTARPVTDDHRGWRMDSARAGGAGFPWMFDHCVHFFATAEYLMKDTRIGEVYSLRSDISWMNARDGSGHAGMYRPESAGDIPIIAWSYDDPACQGVWMRAEALTGKYDPMFGFSVSVIGETGMIEVLGEGGRGLTWQGKDAHLVLHRQAKDTRAFRFDEGGDEIWQSEVSYYSRAHRNQIHEFVDALTGGGTPRYLGADGLRDVRTTMAAICSAREGVPVKVREVTDQRFQA